MAWIKMRTNLWDDPRIAAMADALDTGEAPIIGALYWLWSTADEHTNDGFLQGMTFATLDRKVGIQGFGEALKSVGWIEGNGVGLSLTNHAEHNGKTAKARVQAAQRQEKKRDSLPENNDVTQQSRTKRDESVTGALPRVRVRDRERVKTPQPPRGGCEAFARFWQAYPRKVAKSDALRAWTRRKLAAKVGEIINGLERSKDSVQWTKDGGQFIPYPATWLNREGWTEHPDPMRGEDVTQQFNPTDEEMAEFLGGGDE